MQSQRLVDSGARELASEPCTVCSVLVGVFPMTPPRSAEDVVMEILGPRTPNVDAAFDDYVGLVRAFAAQETAALRAEVKRLSQKYKQYRDIWLARGFPIKDSDQPDLEGTVVWMNTRLLLLEADLAPFVALAKAVQALVDRTDSSSLLPGEFDTVVDRLAHPAIQARLKETA